MDKNLYFNPVIGKWRGMTGLERILEDVLDEVRGEGILGLESY